MHNQLKAALAVEALVLVVAFAFSVLYIVMGWYRTSHVLDVLLVVVWVLVAFALLFVFRARSRVREEMVRRFYLSKDLVYNHEIGYASLSQIMPEYDSYEFVTFAGDALARMSYGFAVAEAPADFQPEFMIATKVFDYHFIGEGDDRDDLGVVVDEWAGTLQRAKVSDNGVHTYEKVGSYANATELALLLDSAGVFDMVDSENR